MMTQCPKAIVIGASAGAVETLGAVLTPLVAGYPIPIIIVVHIPPTKGSKLVTVFEAKCAMRVAEAEDKQPIEPGTIYFAPPNYHLLVEQDHSLSLSNEEEILFSRPSIDALFESAADAYGPHLVGIVLTGANEDGSRGLRMIAEYGGATIVQDPDTAVAAIMPRTALEHCPHSLVLSPDQIAAHLARFNGIEVSHAV